MRAALFVLALWAAALTVYAAAGPHGSSVGATSCARVVHQYLHSAAQAVGVSIHHERLIACHQDGNEAVARVSFDATQEAFGITQHETLAIHLVKSPWSVADVHLVG